MKVRILKSASGPTLTLRSGASVDLPDSVAKGLILHGIAEEDTAGKPKQPDPEIIVPVKKKKK